MLEFDVQHLYACLVSKGLGSIQRSILTFLCVPHTDETFPAYSTDGLADCIWGRRALSPVTASHRETVRRALWKLEQLGLVELFYAKDKGETGEVRQHLAAEATPAGFAAYEKFRPRWPAPPAED